MSDDLTLELLRLLADGASTEQVGRVAAAEPARTWAVQAARRMEDHRGRERSLRALVETARELVAATDPAGVLDAIVRRARGLLMTDVAYLTLFDAERGDTFVRATDGAASPDFRVLRVPLGVGLGGRVAATRQAWWTEDYAADERFTHTATIDAGVGDEGLVAVCGTPLLVEGEFVGVLFAANRSRHVFAPQDVALLGSLATLAALSIRQARSRLAIEHALADLSQAHEAEQRRTQDVVRAAEAHDRFTRLVTQGGGVEDITRLLADLLDGWAVLIDGDGTRRSGAGPTPGAHLEPGQLDPLGSSPLAERARASDRGVSDGGTYAVAVRGRSGVLATLVCGAEELTPLGWRTAERAGAVTALLLLFERERAEARLRLHSDLVNELLSGTLDGVEGARRLHREGLDPARLCLVALRGHDPARSSLATAVAGVVGDDGIVGTHGRTVVALVPGADPGALAVDLVRRLPAPGATAAGAGPVLRTDDLASAFAEASRTVEAMLALGLQGRGGAPQDLGFAGLVVASNPQVGQFVDQVLGPLVGWDARRGTDLVGTLEAYFASARSPSRTAEMLHVHVNTVVQRLERVAELVGPAWSDPEPSLQLQLALHLRRLVARW